MILAFHAGIIPRIPAAYTAYRRSLAPPHRHPSKLPPRATHDPFHHANFTPQHLIYHRRDLLDALDDRALESRLHTLIDVDRHPPAVDGPATRLTAERRCGGTAARWRFRGVGECSTVLDRRGAVARTGKYWTVILNNVGIEEAMDTAQKKHDQ